MQVTGKRRYLTKSRFKIGCECPTKLYYTGKPAYGDNKHEDKFLEALAEGGFQVGALAQVYHEGGIAIESLDSEKAIAETRALLERDSVILYEPALTIGNLLVRVDILVKRGDYVELIEVKAKSFDPREESPFYTKTSLKKGKPEINAEWEPYLLDISFQTFVARQAFPRWKITSSLMLANKAAVASVDGLNQRFFLKKDERGRVFADIAPGTRRADLGEAVLVKVGVDEEIQLLHSRPIGGRSFAEHVEFLSSHYARDERVPPMIGRPCKTCEFRIENKIKSQGLRSGFEDCWKTAAHFTPQDFSRPLVFDLWNFRKGPALIEESRYFIEDITEADINPRPKEGEPGLSSSERQWLQAWKVKERAATPYLDHEGLASEMQRWKFPLHFIDFETTMVAIPFHKGMRPYEMIAFQYSHHLVTQDGRIEHRGEWINAEPGRFPNFHFLKALKRELSNDDGTIFRYATHENTVLYKIHDQLMRSQQPDREELAAWICTITTSPEDASQPWEGQRNMVDLCDLVKRYYYHPMTQGSNSIKDVLPAILADSRFLQDRYSRPIYGAAGGIPSHNYRDWQWIRRDDSGAILDPYKLLPLIFGDLDLNGTERFITDGNIADGGAAMTAYSRMQFTQMTALERERVCKALLQYCELDTLAMVMLYEYWKSLLEET